jgi:hypothetical protein
MWVSVMCDVTYVTVTNDLWMSVCVVNVDKGNNKGVCDDMLDMEKIITCTCPTTAHQIIFRFSLVNESADTWQDDNIQWSMLLPFHSLNTILTLSYISPTPISVLLPNNTAANTVSPSLSAKANDEPPHKTGFLYKKVANKVQPVATTLPDKFWIVRQIHPDLLGLMDPLPVTPPPFTPTGWYTQEWQDVMKIDSNSFLWPEEVKLIEWLFFYHNNAFAWNDDEHCTEVVGHGSPLLDSDNQSHKCWWHQYTNAKTHMWIPSPLPF